MVSASIRWVQTRNFLPTEHSYHNQIFFKIKTRRQYEKVNNLGDNRIRDPRHRNTHLRGEMHHGQQTIIRTYDGMSPAD